MTDKIQKIVNFCVNSDSYTLNEVSNVPSNFLVIQIFDNKCYVVRCETLPDGRMEQRQYSIVKMLQRVLLKHRVPNTLFSWCHHDRTGLPHASIFTHARLPGSKNLIAPDHTYYGYPNKNGEIINTYSSTFKSLVDTHIEWNDKKDECTFIGNMSNPTNYRQFNTQKTAEFLRNEIQMNAVDKNSGDPSFISRESLAGSKYLLHLNGHNGAYTSRLKYLLGAGSLVVYNVNSGPEKNFWQEWWMHEDFFVDGVHYLRANDAEDAALIINRFHENQDEAKKIAIEGKRFFEKCLNNEFSDLLWAEILKEYSRRCTFQLSEVIGIEYDRKDYEEVDE